MNLPNGTVLHASVKLDQRISDPMSPLPVPNTSAGGFSAVAIIQTNGIRNSTRTAVSSICDSTPRGLVRRRFRRTGAASVSAGRGSVSVVAKLVVIVDPPLLAEELQRGDQHDDHEKQPADRRRRAEVELLEALLVEVEHHRLGG